MIFSLSIFRNSFMSDILRASISIISLLFILSNIVIFFRIYFLKVAVNILIHATTLFHCTYTSIVYIALLFLLLLTAKLYYSFNHFSSSNINILNFLILTKHLNSE